MTPLVEQQLQIRNLVSDLIQQIDDLPTDNDKTEAIDYAIKMLSNERVPSDNKEA